jgi:hypothetical protein
VRRRAAEELLVAAPRRIGLLAHLTPENFEAEVARLSDAPALDSPRFRYRPLPEDHDELARDLEGAAERFRAEGEDVLEERAEELSLELRLVRARGAGSLRELAKRRYEDGLEMDEVDALARAWLRAPPSLDAEVDARPVLSDDEADPGSLVCRLRSVLGAARLPVRVLVSEHLAPLAAAGDGFVQVAARRRIATVDVERTVLHEIEAHVRPGLHARASADLLGIAGSARGSDTQEGYALLLEQRGGFLGGDRARELAARHLAGRAAHEGAPFADAVCEVQEAGASRAVAVRAACRAYRGGGLGREVAYLPAYLAVSRAPEPVIAVLSRRRVSVAVALKSLEG